MVWPGLLPGGTSRIGQQRVFDLADGYEEHPAPGSSDSIRPRGCPGAGQPTPVQADPFDRLSVLDQDGWGHPAGSEKSPGPAPSRLRIGRNQTVSVENQGEAGYRTMAQPRLANRHRFPELEERSGRRLAELPALTRISRQSGPLSWICSIRGGYRHPPFYTLLNFSTTRGWVLAIRATASEAHGVSNR